MKGGVWHPLAGHAKGEVLGCHMAVDPQDGIGLFGGLTIGAEREREGLGRVQREGDQLVARLWL